MSKYKLVIAILMSIVFDVGFAASIDKRTDFVESRCTIQPDWIVIYLKSQVEEKEVTFNREAVKFAESPAWSATPYSYVNEMKLAGIQNGFGHLLIEIRTARQESQFIKDIGKVSVECFASVSQFLREGTASAHVTTGEE